MMSTKISIFVINSSLESTLIYVCTVHVIVSRASLGIMSLICLKIEAVGFNYKTMSVYLHNFIYDASSVLRGSEVIGWNIERLTVGATLNERNATRSWYLKSTSEGIPTL